MSHLQEAYYRSYGVPPICRLNGFLFGSCVFIVYRALIFGYGIHNGVFISCNLLRTRLFSKNDFDLKAKEALKSVCVIKRLVPGLRILRTCAISNPYFCTGF